jgi:thymidylate synthase (FAD)
MGSDLSVVNAARVSYNKESEWMEIPFGGKTPGLLEERDEKLIRYLAKHNHWSPFGHTSLQIRVKAPIFVARQLVKHQVGLVWNEVSRRYVDDEVEFYIPDTWRSRPENSKQGSGEEIIIYNIESTLQFVKQTYENLLKANVAPEMARMVLPQNMYTEWYWTGSVMAFARVCNLRCKPDTQWETQQIANQILDILKQEFPTSTEYLCQM